MSLVAARLKALGLELPEVTTPVANYVPFVQTGALLFVSGQLPFAADKTLPYTGPVGAAVSVEDAKAAARLAAINVIAAAKAALAGDLDRITRVIKVTGFVQAAPDFVQHPDVINGASDLFVAVFGDAGRHARVAVGASSLPRNASVEVEAVFEVR